MDKKSELASHLGEVGLDETEFWLSQLERLGVKSTASLKLLDMSSLSQLEKEAKHPVEKKALRKLFKVNESETAKERKKQEEANKAEELQRDLARKRSAKQKEELRIQEENIQKILKELEKARSEQMKRTDEKVQRLESEMRKLLQISPETWISNDKSLDEVISKLEARHQISGQIQAREWLSENDLLKKCSGGRALQGVLLTKILQDQLEDRCRLLEVPENVSISGASDSENKKIQFSSVHQEDQYKKTVDVLGHSVAVSTSVPVYGSVTINASTASSDRTEEEKTHEKHTKEMYSSAVQYSTMHVASYSFEKKDLLLSEDAIRDLKELSKMLKIQGADSANLQQVCEKIFRDYGSHVNKGPLSFGGNFWWTCSSRGFSKTELKSVRKMQSHAISNSAGVAFAGFGISTEVNIEKVKGSYTAECTKDTRASTSLQVKINGGPPEATDLSQWKSGLVANNSTWILTSRGKKLIAVWDIIKMNHEKELGEVREVLRRAWEEMTGLKAEQDLLTILSYDSDIVLKEVSKWKVQHMTPHQIQDNLKYLLKIKKDILNKTANPTFWISEYVSCSSLQDFIHSLMESKLTSSYKEDVKVLLQQLLEEDDLSQLDTRVFPCLVEVSDWLYKSSSMSTHSLPESDITDFESFDSFLDKMVVDARTAELSDSVVPPEKLSRDVSKGINSLQIHYRLKYDNVFITILVYPYQVNTFDGVITLKPITVKDLESLQKSFSEERKRFNEYVKKKPLHLQAYLFHLAVNYRPIQLSQFINKEFLQTISKMMSDLQPPLEPRISEVLNSYLQDSSLKEFKQKLQLLIKSSVQVHPEQPSHSPKKNDLKSVLKVKARQCEAITADASSSVFLKNSEVHALLEKLGLCKHYPKGLRMKDALCIRPESLKLSLSETHPTDPKQLPYLILHKLMSYDSLCRSDLLPAGSKEGGHHKKENDSDEDSDESDEEDESEITSNGIHPVDSLIALILCSDNFLRQDLLSRLAKCQLALPFLLPDPFTKQLTLPLWTMRSIIKEWKCTNKDGEVVQRTHPIVSYEMPIVSFIRFGKHQERGASKSKILNEVISDYDHYFHRDCPGGQQGRLLGEGLVDMCWYLPAGKASDAFPDAVTFLNLHGDGRQHLRQSKFLSQISSMCFILLTEENLEFDSQTIEILKKFNSYPGAITILNDVKKKPESLKKAISDTRVISLTRKNAAEIKDSIRQRIKKNFERLTKLKSVEDLCGIREEGILVDENCEFYRQGLSLANKLTSIVTCCRDKEPNLKDAMLPLQGSDLWRAWAANDKELYRHIERGNKTMNDYNSDINEIKAEIRTKQLKYVNSLTPMMQSFTDSLLRLGGSSNQILRNYFLQCLKLELNNLSRESISEMQHQYQCVRKELSKLQAKSSSHEGEIKTKSDKLKKELEDLQEDIINSSFGLEHLFRELGQVYEAALESGDYGENLSCLPKAAAELFIDGYPLELMDGDAAHVPLQWVTAVLHSAVEMLGDPNIFVLSVLGLQSTGKSTMLNTAFGLQFNVSAGRCTRGAFMQLLPLDEELRQKTKCEYVLVVDTEGLRAPELDPLKTQKHDNELATFVIGLANTTLINIYGEVAGDMDDILQTSVHAFLRMTKVKFNPSCQFVHQNAGANINSEVGRAKFSQKLNQITIDAAREENCEGQFKSFNDVIKFDDQNDVHHFPGLWKGDPPMAPINKGYSQSAQMLKKHFIKILCERASKIRQPSSERKVGGLSLSSFTGRMKDLWEALLQEKFVFSFKNTLEITAYNSLETAYSMWDWTFTEAMLKWEQKAENAIRTAPLKDVPALVKDKCKKLEDYVSDQIKPLKLQMKEFFNGKQSEILVQWKAKFERRLENLLSELKIHAEDHCRKLGKSREVITKFESERNRYAEIITAKVHEHIASIKKEQEILDQSLKEGKLKSKQLKKLLHRRLFTPENTQLYEEQQIITADQARQINAIIYQCGGQLTEGHLNDILVRGVLATDQVRKILKKRRQTEEELKEIFNSIWIELMHQLPSVSGDPRDVEAEIERKMIGFVRAQGHEGQFLAKYREKKSLMEWGGSILEFLPEKKKHYTKHSSVGSVVTQVVSFFFRGEATTVDAYQKGAIDTTEKIFSTARKYLEDTTQNDTDFNTAFVQELLQKVDATIARESAYLKDLLIFTLTYKHEMYLTVCGYAVPEFERMAESFREKNDPRFYLENNLKGPLFTKFKNQYNQTEAEEAIANTLCSYLELPIKEQVGKTLGAKMVGVMKSSEHHFTSKMALKVKILTDLIRKDDFDSYMSYVSDVKEYLEDRIKYYTIQFCDEKVSGGNTRLQTSAKEKVNDLVGVVQGKVTDLNEKDARKWLSAFSSDTKIREELGVALKVDELLEGYDDLNELNLENFKSGIRSELNDLKKKLQKSFDTVKCEREMVHWKDKPHVLLGNLIGCTKQCPFCREQCDYLDPDHYLRNNQNHQVATHRPDCLAGYRWSSTKILATDFCPAQIADGGTTFSNTDTQHQSYSYSDYEKIYPDWSIPPDRTSKGSEYWMWFVGKYKEELGKKFSAKPPQVPSQWLKIKKEEAEKNLKETYKV